MKLGISIFYGNRYYLIKIYLQHNKGQRWRQTHLRHGSTKKEKEQWAGKTNKKGPDKFIPKKNGTGYSTSKEIYEANVTVGHEEEENTRAINNKYLKLGNIDGIT